MRSQLPRTLIYCAAAILLVVAAAWVEPELSNPEIFTGQGQPLFPDFRDVLAVKAVEVVDYDETAAIARPLKVEFRKGRWVLSSHGDYPAEAQGRMAKTAAALLGLTRETVVSDRWEDHARLGVIDPLDTKQASLTGRGKRVTLRDAQGAVLANVILGGAVQDKAGYRYLRLPNEKRTWAVKTDADASARFEDWVESNLLRISPSAISRIVVNSYSIDETMGRLANVRRVAMTREGGSWKIDPPNEASPAAAARIATALGGLRVVGARAKPAALAAMLRSGQLSLTLETVMSMRQRGFYLTPDGRLLANAGELQVETTEGIIYSIRFGEIVSGDTETTAPASPSARQGEDRYVFITAGVDGAPAAQDGSGNGQAAARRLEERFADWYYVISGADFARLRALK